MTGTYKAGVLNDGDILQLTSPSGEKTRFHALWLRDNALDEMTRSGANGQRLITVSDIPVDLKMACAKMIDEDSISITFKPEEKTVYFSVEWLMAHAYDRSSPSEIGWLAPEIEIWDGALSDSIRVADFETVRTDPDALAGWLTFLRKYGFAKMSGCPVESGALIDIAALFGFVRETNYGKWFDVRTEVNPTNLAFTSAGLQAHTDNPYRDPVPTMQILYCLENTAEGGLSKIVDGFQAVKKLQSENEEYFRVLSRYCANFEYAGDKGVHLTARKPMIECTSDGQLAGVRFNNRSAAPFTDVPFEEMSQFYVAYRRLGEIIDDPGMEIRFKLEPGECFIVDNTRVLHSRTAYSGKGKRWLQGCYPDKDGMLSTLACLKQFEQSEKRDTV